MSATTIDKGQILQQYLAYGVQINTSPLSFMSSSPETVSQQAVSEFQKEGSILIKVSRSLTSVGGLSFIVWAGFNTPDGIVTIDDFGQTLLLKTNQAMIFGWPSPSIGGYFSDPSLYGPPAPVIAGLPFSPIMLFGIGFLIAYFVWRWRR